MTIEMFRSALLEMYQTSPYDFLPRCSKKVFYRYSCTSWAAEELIFYIEKELYPRQEASPLEFYGLTENFLAKVQYYKTLNKNNTYIFETAASVAEGALDLLVSMGEF